jgi:hypothetical protein
VTSSRFVATSGLSPRPGASKTELAAAEQAIGQQLPDEYRALLRETNGLEGFVASDVYLMLWSTHEIADLNAGYSTAEFAPGLVLLGTDGGDTGYGYLAGGPRSGYVAVPLVGMAIEAAEPMGRSLTEFLHRLRAGR